MMTDMKITRYCFAVLVLASLGAQASESRQHFLITNGSNRFTATRIDNVDTHRTISTVLMRDEKTGRLYRFESTRNYVAQTAEYRLSDVAGKEFVSARYNLPLKAASREATGAELRAMQKSTIRVPLTLSVPGQSHTLNEEEWLGGTGGPIRAKLRGHLSAEFQDMLARISSVMSVPQLSDFCFELVGRVVGEVCRPVASVRLATMPPDCAFDASFGATCSEKQMERAKAVRKAGKGSRY